MDTEVHNIAPAPTATVAPKAPPTVTPDVPAPTVSVTAAPDEQLPVTGADSTVVFAVGLSILMVGLVLLLLVARLRRGSAPIH